MKQLASLAEATYLEHRYERAINTFGCSFDELGALRPSLRLFRKGPQRFRNALKRVWCEAEARLTEMQYERAINEFGYSFDEVIAPVPASVARERRAAA